MAEKVELDIEISPEGSATIHIRGIKGKKCLDIAKKLEKSLGRISEQRNTGEYYEQEEAAGIHQRV